MDSEGVYMRAMHAFKKEQNAYFKLKNTAFMALKKEHR